MNKIKKMADKVVKFSDWNGTGFLRKIAEKEIELNGFYSYKTELQDKIFVEK